MNNRRILLTLATAVVVTIGLLLVRHQNPTSKEHQALVTWTTNVGAPFTKELGPLTAALGTELTSVARNPTNAQVLADVHQNCLKGQVAFKSIVTESLPPVQNLRGIYAAMRRTGTSMFADCLVIFPGRALDLTGTAPGRFFKEITRLDVELNAFLSKVRSDHTLFSN